MVEALYYNKLEENIVKCVLCPHNCVLSEGHYGICNSRKNIKGSLMATSYGNLCSLSVDPIEKKPLMNYLPGTTTYSISSAGCNFRCLQCQNDGISQYKPEERTVFKATPEQIVDNAINSGCKSISYTYTEPTTFYEFMLDTSKIANTHGIKNVVVSNGYINEKPLRELCDYVHAFNIDLKYWSNLIYKKISGGNLDTVLNTLKIIKENNCWLEITNLIIPEINDSIDMIREMCDWLVNNDFDKFPLHFSRFYPKYKLMETVWTPMDIMYESQSVAKRSGMKYVYLGNVNDEKSRDVYCPNCNKNVIRRIGYEIMENNIGLMGICNYCGEQIDGVF